MIPSKFPRRAASLFTIAAILALAPDMAAAQLKHGDVNGDGVVSALDAQAILTNVVGLQLPSGYVVANGDANCDAATGALDAQIVLSFVIGLDVSQHCVGQAFGPGALTLTLTPTDTSVLINKGLRFRAILMDSVGSTLQRPTVWSSSNTDLVAIDSARGDTAWVSNKGAAFDATATLTATADGISRSTTIRVHKTYAGITITPQKIDTLRQLNANYNFQAQLYDSLGADIGNPTAFWSVADTTIATIPGATATHTGVLKTKTNGTTWLIATSSTNPSDKDSIRIVVSLPLQSSCSATSGTVYPTTTFTTPQTWAPATGPYFVNGTLTFNSGANLTIEPGTLICGSSSGWMRFLTGARVTAVGTVAQPITFTATNPNSPWSGIQLGDNSSYVTTPLPDTSRFTNVLFERASDGDGAIDGRQQHVVLLDSVVIRQSPYGGVAIRAPGSRIIRSTIDTIATNSSGYYAVSLGRGSLEETVIRVGTTNAHGIELEEAATVRQVTIAGGETAINQLCCTDSARLNDVTITGAAGKALVLDGGLIHPLSGNVTVTGGQDGVFRGRIGNFAHLYADSVAQESLKNNGNDTVHIANGELVQRTLTLRPDLQWRMQGTITIDTGATLVVRPGATLDFDNGYLYFQRGGRIDARGTATARIRLRPMPGSVFYGLELTNPGAGSSPFSTAPVAESFLTNIQLDSAQGVCCSGGFGYAAISSTDRHRVTIDSALVRMSRYGAVHLGTRGSSISRSLIDTTGAPTSSYVALGLADSTTADSVTVRRSGYIGVDASGAGVRLRQLRVEDSEDVGLQAQGGRIIGDSGTVVLTANAYPFRGHLDNFFLLVPDSASQLNFLGNTTDEVVIVGNSSRRFQGRAGRLDTARVIPQLPWQVLNDVYIDTLARLMPSPGARLGFWSGSLNFHRGGRLYARGTAANPITFEKYSPSSGQFLGFDFENAGGTARDTSFFINAVVRQMDNCQFGVFGCAGIASQNRHVVFIDSTTIRGTTYSAASLGAPGSRIFASLIDSAGTPGLGNYPGLEIGPGTRIDSVTVQNARGEGVRISGGATAADTVRLRKLTILNSGDVALRAEGGARIVGDLGGVIASGNGSPFRGNPDNFAALARDSVTQLQLLGNVSNTATIMGTSSRPFIGRPGADSLIVIPQLQWLVVNDMYLDSLARLRVSPGARIGFWSGSMHFQSGARLISRGTAANPVVMERHSPSSGTFDGLRFLNRAGTEVDTSVIVNTIIRRVEGCQSGALGCAVLAPANRHVLLVDSSTFQATTYTAVSLGAPGSRLSRSLVDTAGQPSSYAAVELGAATLAESTTIRHARGIGLLVSGSITTVTDTVRLRGMTILNSGSYGLHASAGRIVGDSGSVVLTGNAAGFRGYPDNLGAIARDSVAQLNFLGNTDNTLTIDGRSDRPFVGRPGRDTIRVIPQAPWLVVNDVYFDSLAVFQPGRGTRVGFWSGSLHFRAGGRLNSRGTAAEPVVMERHSTSSGTFNGIQFLNRSAGVDTSYIVNTLIRRIESCQNGALGCAVLAPQDRHVLLIDSSTVRAATHTAVSLGSPGSRIRWSLVDTAGQPTSYAAMELGRLTRAETTTVRFARGTGVLTGGAITALGDTIRLSGLTIQNSAGAGLHAEGGRIVGDSGGVVLSNNAYPFYGYIDNFAALARDSVRQMNFVGNTDNVAYIIGRDDRPLVGQPLRATYTLWAIPQLRLEFRGQTYIDTLAQLMPRKGSRLTFENGGLIFRRGGTLNATGTASDTIRFVPSRAGVNFFGLSFQNPGLGGVFDPVPVASSQIAFARIDSASGQSGGTPFTGQAAITSGDRHQLHIFDTRLRRSQDGAVYVGTPLSSLTRVFVDTTGNPTTTQSAIALNDSIDVDSLVVTRSGASGIYTLGRGISMNKVWVRNSLQYGLFIDGNSATGSRGLNLFSFTSQTWDSFVAENNGLGGVLINADSVRLANCTVRNNGTTSIHHGIQTNSSSFRGIRINNCNLENNAGLGVNNWNTTDGQFIVDADQNYWGNAGGPTAGDGVSANVSTVNSCSSDCTNTSFLPMQQAPSTPAIPPRDYVQRGRRTVKRRKGTMKRGT